MTKLTSKLCSGRCKRRVKHVVWFRGRSYCRDCLPYVSTRIPDVDMSKFRIIKEEGIYHVIARDEYRYSK